MLKRAPTQINLLDGAPDVVLVHAGRLPEHVLVLVRIIVAPVVLVVRILRLAAVTVGPVAQPAVARVQRVVVDGDARRLKM